MRRVHFTKGRKPGTDKRIFNYSQELSLLGYYLEWINYTTWYASISKIIVPIL